MPQATPDLRARWADDSTALGHLHGRYLVGRGGVIQPLVGTVPTSDDYSAIDYLIQEWDYGYNEIPVHPRPRLPEAEDTAPSIYPAGAELEGGPGEAAPGGERPGAVANEGPPAGFGAFDPTPLARYQRPLNLALLASVSLRLVMVLVLLGLFGAILGAAVPRHPILATAAVTTVVVWLTLMDGVGYLRDLWRDLQDVCWVR